MKTGLHGNLLPENVNDFNALKLLGGLTRKYCLMCGEDFSEENTHTAPGWRDTQIVGLCENCYDQHI